jgi:integrase/recombinase XerD
MSGGPYGRGKAPERACLKLKDWPDEDRRLWQAACKPGDLLAGEEGARADHAIASNRKAERGYGRWLTFLQMTDPGGLAEAPALRVTPDRVRRYVDSLICLNNSTATILARLQELGEVARIMGPNLSWTFINALGSRIRARHKPLRDKRNLKLSDELLDLGLSLIDKATVAAGLEAAILHRDGLMIALLALVPLRRRNFAGLRLDRNLVEINGSWLISLDACETKTHAPLEILWPGELVGPLGTYLNVHRPLLSATNRRWAKPIDNALWVSSHGSPMTEMAIYDRIRKHTRLAFGAAINPHLFRDAAATTLAIADPAHVRVAAPLLGHRTFTTTERFYQQAQSFDAHRAYVGAIFGKGKRS